MIDPIVVIESDGLVASADSRRCIAIRGKAEPWVLADCLRSFGACLGLILAREQSKADDAKCAGTNHYD